MRKYLMGAVLVLALAGGGVVLSGCGVAKAVGGFMFGVTEEDKDQDGVPDVERNWFHDLVGTVLPWGDEALLGLGGIYAALRAKKWKQVAVATMKGAESFAETEVGKPVADKLKAKLAENHVAAKVYSLVKTTLDKQGINKPEAGPTTPA